jgi:hypothetical protein
VLIQAPPLFLQPRNLPALFLSSNNFFILFFYLWKVHFAIFKLLLEIWIFSVL